MDALNSLYELLTGIQRSREKFSWEWQDGPYGPAPSWVIEERATGKVVAHHGVIPVPLWMGNERILAARTENTMLNPAYRGQFLYHIHERKILNELHKTFPVVFTTSGKGGHGAIRKHLGYQDVGLWRTYNLSSGWRYFARRLMPGLIKVTEKTPIWHESNLAVALTSDMDRVERLWHRCRRNHTHCLEREAPYLRWRFQNNPYHHYETALILKGGVEFGFLVWRVSRDDVTGQSVLIEDFFLDEYTMSNCRQVLEMFCAPWRKMGVRVSLRTLVTPSPLINALTYMASQRIGANTHKHGGAAFLVHSGSNAAALRDGDHWQVTMGLAQGI